MSGEEDICKRPEILALIDEMEAHGRERNAPVRTVMGLLGDRWTTLILLVLKSGGCNHSALRRIVSDISNEGAVTQRVLTLKLRALERDGFVAREVTSDVPPRVRYSLTPLGDELAKEARSMIDWVNAHAVTIHASRAAFDRRI